MQVGKISKSLLKEIYCGTRNRVGNFPKTLPQEEAEFPWTICSFPIPKNCTQGIFEDPEIEGEIQRYNFLGYIIEALHI